jgi:Flp pilus assembly protein TadD
MTLALVLAAAALVTQPDPAATAQPSTQEPSAQARPAAAAEPGAASAALESGLNAVKRRRFAQAEADFRRATEADPGNAAAHYYLGYLLYKRGEPARRMNDKKVEARAEFERAYELDPGFRPVWDRK